VICSFGNFLLENIKNEKIFLNFAFLKVSYL
jgi:hypothetical protein